MSNFLVELSDTRNSNKNYVINGNFDFWQRGTSLTSGTGARFLADRFRNESTGSTYTASRQLFTTGQNEVPNNPSYFHRTVVSSVAGASNYCILNHKIEGVETLSNKQVTISFWAKADSNKPIAIEFYQYFGTGSVFSPQVNAIGVKKVNLTTSWQKITHTVYIPSIAGKTIGSNNNDSLNINFWFDAGSSWNSNTDSLGQQSGTFDIAQVQIEEGSRAREFVLAGGNLEGELTACQRYYEKSYLIDVDSGSATLIGTTGIRGINGAAWYVTQFKVRKRVAPMITTWDWAGNINKYRVDGLNNSSDGAITPSDSNFTTTSSAAVTEHFHQWAADAEL